jgi:hypothetical protein
MLDEYQAIEALIDEIKGTSGFVSGLLFGKSGLVILFVLLGVIVSKIVLK